MTSAIAGYDLIDDDATHCSGMALACLALPRDRAGPGDRGAFEPDRVLQSVAATHPAIGHRDKDDVRYNDRLALRGNFIF